MNRNILKCRKLINIVVSGTPNEVLQIMKRKMMLNGSQMVMHSGAKKATKKLISEDHAIIKTQAGRFFFSFLRRTLGS